ncbi:MAG TPA: hypothetical protein VJ861_12015 [Treponemataceae bacterium]|nr:hypothetical protein [Treponemataceae bacterium]
MTSFNKELLQKAFRTCTWGNTTETLENWILTLQGNDENAKKRLFKKLFLESGNASIIRELFSEEQIKVFLKDFNKILHRSHLERRRKVWRFLYLEERTPIPELDWLTNTQGSK